MEHRAQNARTYQKYESAMMEGKVKDIKLMYVSVHEIISNELQL